MRAGIRARLVVEQPVREARTDLKASLRNFCRQWKTALTAKATVEKWSNPDVCLGDLNKFLIFVFV